MVKQTVCVKPEITTPKSAEVVSVLTPHVTVVPIVSRRDVPAFVIEGVGPLVDRPLARSMDECARRRERRKLLLDWPARTYRTSSLRRLPQAHWIANGGPELASVHA
jgi:hypothetical protein